MTSKALHSDPQALARVVDRLAESRAVLLLDVRADGTRRVVAERPGYVPRYLYLAEHLQPVETLLVRLLEVWGDGYGACLFFELWGCDAERYGGGGGKLRRAALIGPVGPEAESLTARVARAMQLNTQGNASANLDRP